MKRTKESKIYEFIGRAVVFILAHAMWVGLLVYGFMQNTIY